MHNHFEVAAFARNKQCNKGAEKRQNRFVQAGLRTCHYAVAYAKRPNVAASGR